MDRKTQAGRSSGRSWIPDALLDQIKRTRDRLQERWSDSRQGTDESERIMKITAGFGVGAIVGLLLVWFTLPVKDPLDIYAEAYKAGRTDALKTRYSNGNPNWELEQVCVGMWMAKQEEQK